MTSFDAGQPIVVGNWKQNTGRDQAVLLASRIAGQPVQGVLQAICPPTIWLAAVHTALGVSPIRLGAQDSSAKPDGAFTGQVSATMIAELCSFVLVGHSERRQMLGETDDVVAEKLRRALDAGLDVVLCVGETAEERDRGDAAAVVQRQLHHALAHADAIIDSIVVAYEPIWAIGTGRSATPDDAAAMAVAIRAALADLLPGRFVPILYGGSVSSSNASSLIGGDVDGFLVGGASLQAQEFVAICHAARTAD